MRELAGKVCVVTGAASGIGLALAEHATAAGMKVVLADVERLPLQEAETRLQQAGCDVAAVACDVSKPDQVEALAARAVELFGGIQLLCANAGVFGGFLPLWERDAADWAWQFDVNVLGVGNCLRSFVPLMLRQGDEGHILITASEAGFNIRPYTGVYNATKHALVALAETLALELALVKANIRVTALCPGGVNTRILDAERNRPDAAQRSAASTSEQTGRLEQRYRRTQPQGMSPDRVAELAFDAVREGKFYLFTHPELKEPMRRRFEGAMAERNPEPDAGTVARLGQAAE
ncbi:MAG: SDR family NAD(P)-dependent oxidoreductase [Dehalococcoidia bacterium]